MNVTFSNIEGYSDNLDKFENILQIFINSPVEELYKEVKSMILIEFENISNQLKNYFDQNNNEIYSKYIDFNRRFFNNLCYSVLFTISSFTLKIDYYSFTINTLVDKLNRFFIDLVNLSSTSKEFFRSLTFVEKFVKIKRSFLKDICYNKSHLNSEESSALFNFNKFSSFGRYFFNNLNEIIDLNEDPHNFPNPSINLYTIYKQKFYNGRKEFIWKNKIVKSNYLNKFFVIYFNSKLINWKVSIIKENKEKSNMCRVCEKKFSSIDFLMHTWFCKEINTYVPEVKRFSNKIDILLKELQKYKE